MAECQPRRILRYLHHLHVLELVLVLVRAVVVTVSGEARVLAKLALSEVHVSGHRRSGLLEALSGAAVVLPAVLGEDIHVRSTDECNDLQHEGVGLVEVDLELAVVDRLGAFEDVSPSGGDRVARVVALIRSPAGDVPDPVFGSYLDAVMGEHSLPDCERPRRAIRRHLPGVGPAPVVGVCVVHVHAEKVVRRVGLERCAVVLAGGP